jgi:hypothetical protein
LTILTEGIVAYVEKLRTVGKGFAINRVKQMSSGYGTRAKWGEVGKPLAKVEIEARAFDEITQSKGKFPFRVKTPGDIYTDKIFANLARFDTRSKSSRIAFKPSDLFDLDYLTKSLGIEPVPKSRILDRASAYGKREIVTPELIGNLVEAITDPEKEEMYKEMLKKTLLPDVAPLFPFDRAFFLRIAEHYEQYI